LRYPSLFPYTTLFRSKVLPNTGVEFGIRDGIGCDISHFTEEERAGHMKFDEHLHEHATCYNVRDRGLVVITSCGHAGILNTIRRSEEHTSELQSRENL